QDAAGDTAATTSTVTATSSAHQCPILLPTSSFDLSQNDAAPCGSSKAQQFGNLLVKVNAKAGPNNLTATLAKVAAPATPGGAFANNDITPETTVCTSTSGDGCLEAQQYRARGTVTLLTLPSALPGGDLPSGYDSSKGLVQLTGFSDSLTSEAGLGSSAPTVTIAGTLSHYNCRGYRTISRNGRKTAQ